MRYECLGIWIMADGNNERGAVIPNPEICSSVFTQIKRREALNVDESSVVSPKGQMIRIPEAYFSLGRTRKIIPNPPPPPPRFKFTENLIPSTSLVSYLPFCFHFYTIRGFTGSDFTLIKLRRRSFRSQFHLLVSFDECIYKIRI